MNKNSGERHTLKDYRPEYQANAEQQLPPCLGFSARLNLLWDLVGIAPAPNEGRVLAVMGLNSDWRESEVRGWLQRDELPSRLELRNMVRFLVSHIEDAADAEHWEAFLLYGSPLVSSPVSEQAYRKDSSRRDIAALIFARITERFAISPAAYDADLAFQRCLALMQKFNIYEAQDFQPGHLEPFKRVMFPD